MMYLLPNTAKWIYNNMHSFINSKLCQRVSFQWSSFFIIISGPYLENIKMNFSSQKNMFIIEDVHTSTQL